MPASAPAEFAVEPIVLPYELHDYQKAFLGDVLPRVDADDAQGAGRRWLYASPTGSGKSLMELALLLYAPDWLLVTPRLEIVAGMLQKVGVDTSGWGDAKLAAVALRYRITTPVRLRNMLAAGELPFRPGGLIVDEVHHGLADTYQEIAAYLPGLTWVGLTATPYRGTPKGTAEFLKQWEDQYTWVLTLKQAAERGIIEVPGVELWPLVDDDEVRVVNGEIQASAAGEVVAPRLVEVVERCRQSLMVVTGGHGYDAPEWDRPTLFAVPTTDNVNDLVARLNDAGLPAVGVTQDTPRAERNDAFRRCVAREAAIVQIDVVSEGVDLPIRRLVDLRPTLSPVRWMQQLGRITRPRPKYGYMGVGEVKYQDPPSVYVCCNRNLERHGYLFDGLIPPAYIAQAQKVFPKRSERAAARAVGLEGVGRFSPAEVELADGCVGTVYHLYATDGFTRREYAVLLHPAVERPLVATRHNVGDGAGAVTYGKWERIDELPVDLRGFQSSPPNSLSDKQRAWWARDAARFGLAADAGVNRRNFVALPVLADLSKRGNGRVRLAVGGF